MVVVAQRTVVRCRIAFARLRGEDVGLLDEPIAALRRAEAIQHVRVLAPQRWIRCSDLLPADRITRSNVISLHAERQIARRVPSAGSRSLAVDLALARQARQLLRGGGQVLRLVAHTPVQVGHAARPREQKRQDSSATSSALYVRALTTAIPRAVAAGKAIWS